MSARDAFTTETVEPPKTKAAPTYDSAADHFDDAPLAFLEQVWPKHDPAPRAAGGASVLDVGCGSGASARPAAQAVGPSGRVVDAVLSEERLGLERKKAHEPGLGNIEFRIGDKENLGYEDGQSGTDAIETNVIYAKAIK